MKRSVSLAASALAATGAVALLVQIGSSTPRCLHDNTVWTVHVGPPQHQGTATFDIEWSYQEGSSGTGALKSGTTSVVVEVGADMTALDKKQALLEKLETDAPTVGGQPVFKVHGGLNNTVQIGPNQDGGLAFGSAKVKAIKAKDQGTNERDRVDAPPKAVPAPDLVEVTVDGEIAGVDADGAASVLTISSPFVGGTHDVALDATTRRNALLREVEGALRAGGARTFLAVDGLRLYVLVDDEDSLAIGSTDVDLITGVKLMRLE